MASDVSDKYRKLMAEAVAEGRVSFPTMSPNVKRTIYAPEIAQILGIPETRAVTACVHARLQPYTNDAFAEQDVRDLRARWDAGTACDVMDLGEVQAELRSSALSARNWLSENGIRPVNPHAKPHLFDRLQVMGKIGTRVIPGGAVVADERTLRADKQRREQEIYQEYQDRVASLKRERDQAIADNRAEYDAQIAALRGG